MNAPSLVGVEGRRFASRRLVRVVVGAGLIGIVLAGTLTYARSNRDVDGATARARAAAVAEHEACLRGEFPDYHEAQPGAGVEVTCGEFDAAQVTADPRFHLTGLTDGLAGSAALIAVIGLVLGASSIGAEWHHRTMTTTLTWEPRRIRVALAKLAAAASIVFVGALAFQALLGAALYPAALFRGTLQGTTTAWFTDLSGIVLRGAVLAGLAAAIGGAIALIGRNTAAALGVGFVWMTVIEGMLRGGVRGSRPWLLGENATGFVVAGTEAARSILGSGIMLALYGTVLVSIAVEAFRRRDVA